MGVRKIADLAPGEKGEHWELGRGVGYNQNGDKLLHCIFKHGTICVLLLHYMNWLNGYRLLEIELILSLFETVTFFTR